MQYIKMIVGGVAVVAAAVLGSASTAVAATGPQSVVVAQKPVNWSPQVLDGRVQALVRVGNTIVVGGSFTKVRIPGGAVLERSDLFAFDATTGAIDPRFAPTFAGGSVFTLSAVPGAKGVFVGGRFTKVNGDNRHGVVRLRLADGSVDPSFHPAVGAGVVDDSAVLAGRLYISGAFTTVGGQPRTGFAAVDAGSGAVVPDVNVSFAAPTVGALEVTHFDIAPDGSRLVAAGSFTTVNGLDRAQIAILNLQGGSVSVANWETDRFKTACKLKVGGIIRDVAFSPDSSYFVVGATGGGIGLCDSISRWDARAVGSRRLETWDDPTGGDSITQIAVTGTAIYAGGHQRWVENTVADPRGRGAQPAPGAVPRSGIAALDPINGMPFSWNPGRKPRGTGVYAFLVTPEGLWMGSDTGYTDGMYRPRLAMFPTVGGTVIAPGLVGTATGALYTIGRSGLVRTGFSGVSKTVRPSAVRSGVDWSRSRGAFMVGQTLFTFTVADHLIARSFKGSAVGAPRDLPLYGLSRFVGTASSLGVAGAFYDPASGRLFYIKVGDSALYSRPFEPQSGLLGAAVQHVAMFRIRGSYIQPTTITRIGSFVYFNQGADLYRIAFNGRTITGKPVRVSGPSVDRRNWSGARGLFVRPA